MPTIIVLDISLSMRRTVIAANGIDSLSNEPTRHHLAVCGIHTLLQYLQSHCKLEFVSLVKI